MKLLAMFALLLSHGFAAVVGFALGIYLLPILIAPAAPTEAELNALVGEERYSGTFVRNLKDSDALHWGEGRLSVSRSHISLLGDLAPGPDYKLYVSPSFIETEAAFEANKNIMVFVGNVNTFSNFKVSIPDAIDIEQFNSVIVWCERFGEFITAAQYR